MVSWDWISVWQKSRENWHCPLLPKPCQGVSLTPCEFPFQNYRITLDQAGIGSGASLSGEPIRPPHRPLHLLSPIFRRGRIPGSGGTQRPGTARKLSGAMHGKHIRRLSWWTLSGWSEARRTKKRCSWAGRGWRTWRGKARRILCLWTE